MIRTRGDGRGWGVARENSLHCTPPHTTPATNPGASSGARSRPVQSGPMTAHRSQKDRPTDSLHVRCTFVARGNLTLLTGQGKAGETTLLSVLLSLPVAAGAGPDRRRPGGAGGASVGLLAGRDGGDDQPGRRCGPILSDRPRHELDTPRRLRPLRSKYLPLKGGTPRSVLGPCRRTPPFWQPRG